MHESAQYHRRVEEGKEGLSDDNGDGLKIQGAGGTLLNVSAWPYTMQDLEAAQHIHELPRRNTITLNVDLKQRGVGDLSTPILGLPEYARLLADIRYAYSFRLRPCAQDGIVTAKPHNDSELGGH